MQAAAVAWTVGILGLASVVATGCAVRRQSSEFSCIIDLQCDSGRICDRGYCVERGGGGSGDCPEPCTTCDLGARTCRIECSASKPCDIVLLCPSGFDCTFQCSDPDACQDISCLDARSCDITCTGARACDSISCGDGPCKTDCEGPRACGFVSCGSSCRCDVQCNGATTSQCPDTACPFNANFDYCGVGGNVEGLCDSSRPLCNVCS